MKNSSLSSSWHFLLAGLFCAGLIFVWSAPALLMGDGFGFFPHMEARNFAETGMFSFTDTLGRILSTDLISIIGVPSAADGRLSRVLIAWLSQWIAWGDLVLWTIAGSAVLAMGMLLWWATVLKLFGERAAWATLVITALMPVYFREAAWFDNYNLALTCLAASGAAFVWLKDKRPMIAFLIAGLLFGASISAKDVFLIMIPWIGVTFLWKRQWIGGTVFFVAAVAVYILPYISDISTLGYPVNQNIARVWPRAEAIANETYLHLYPDPYTYYFNREVYDVQFISDAKDKSFSDRMADEKVMLSYGLESSVLRRIRLSMWLIVHDIPPFFQRQTAGGVFLWLFALPGIIALYKRDRSFVMWLLGLVVSMYVVIRFVLMYEREHFMNIAWVFALFVGYGIAELSTMQKKVGVGLMTGVLVAVCVLQLLQANRYEFAARYRRSTVADLRGTAAILKALPKESIVAIDAHPSDVESLALLSNRTLVLFREFTIEDLRDKGLRTVFDQYGVTHALDYAVQTPAIGISSENGVDAPPSAFTKWLIHFVR
ncbi:MAG: glycosyltransferase family 87 protein [bacterium]|nr:glycosyltransferase family 87 protein [bacterium]